MWFIHMCGYVCVCVCPYMYVCVCVCVCVCLYASPTHYTMCYHNMFITVFYLPDLPMSL